MIVIMLLIPPPSTSSTRHARQKAGDRVVLPPSLPVVEIKGGKKKNPGSFKLSSK